MKKLKCIFCGKDLSKEKYDEDYTLITWTDDPEDPKSFNKIAETSHFKCFNRFKELNNLYED